MNGTANIGPCFRILTPPGRGAVATTLVRGPNLDTALDRLFRTSSNRPFVTLATHQIAYGIWISGDSAGEDVVVCRLDEVTAEIHSHGGTSVTESIAEALRQHGFSELDSASALQILTGDGWQSEVRAALADAFTQRTALILLRQLDLQPRQIAKIVHSLETGDSESAHVLIQSMLEWSEFGCQLAKPRSVVLFGAPNVGKSSLINAIVGYSRVIVHETPGTTRDTVTELTAAEGWPFQITDTAGIRANPDAIEGVGIDHARKKMAAADVLVHVRDATVPGTSSEDLLQEHHGTATTISVLNKVDLLEDRPVESNPDTVLVSAKTGEGIDLLLKRISERLNPSIPADDQALPVSDAQVDRLNRALEHIANGDLPAAIDCLTMPFNRDLDLQQ